MASVSEALRASDYAEALDGLLEIWRTTHHPTIADFIDGVAALLGRETELTSLLDSLTPDLDLVQLVERFERLRMMEADPRLSKGLSNLVAARLASTSPRSAASGAAELRFYERVLEDITSLRDPRATAILSEAAHLHPTHPWTPLVRGVAEASEAALRAEPPIRVDARFLDSVRRELPALPVPSELPPKEPRARRAWDLLQRIHDVPDDDETRLVYGDALSEIGDPRGEAIAIAFKVAEGKARVTDRRRLDQLVKKHGSKWLGRARGLTPTEDVVFEKGFPVLLRVPTSYATRWDDMGGVPELATVRTLDLCRAMGVLRAALSSPSMRNVRELRLETNGLYALGHSQAVFPHIASLELVTSMLTQEALETIRAAFPSLRRLGVQWWGDRSHDRTALRATDPATILAVAGTFEAGVDELSFTSEKRLSDFAANVFATLPRLAVTVRRLVIGSGPEGFVLARDDADETTWRLAIERRGEAFDPARVRLLLAALPEDLPLVTRTIEIPASPTRTRKK
jgi:uncharacterized protein (TIGR02996 family)